MMKLVISRLVAICLPALSLLGMIGSSAPAFAQGSTQYQLTWLGEGRPRDLNESGLVAFGWSPYLYDHGTRIKHDLNQLAGATWYDGEDNVTGQWTVTHSNGINDNPLHTQVIGRAYNSTTDTSRNFVLIDPLGPEPVFDLVPTNVLDGTTYNVCINDLGEIAVGREINNGGLIVGGGGNGFPQGTVILPDGSTQVFEGHYFTGVNEAGMITGYRDEKKGKNGWGSAGSILFDFPGAAGPEDLIQSGTTTNWHGDLNNHNDVAFADGGRGWIYLFESDRSKNLDDLIVNDRSSQAYLDWINSSILPSGINDQGQIIGQASVNGVWSGFILDPIDLGPTLSVSDVEVAEGDSGETSGSFTVSLSELTGNDVIVEYVITAGTATAGVDYIATDSGLLVFEFGSAETTKDVEFSIIGDTARESDETFSITLGEPVGGATVTNGTGTATIKDDDKKGGGRGK